MGSKFDQTTKQKNLFSPIFSMNFSQFATWKRNHNKYRISAYSFRKFAGIFYNLQIQKRIVSAETIHGNMVFIKKIRRFRIHRLFGGMIPWALLKFRNPGKDYQIQEIKFTSNIFTRHWGETLLLSMLSLDSAEFDSKAAARLAAP